MNKTNSDKKLYKISEAVNTLLDAFSTEEVLLDLFLQIDERHGNKYKIDDPIISTLVLDFIDRKRILRYLCQD